MPFSLAHSTAYFLTTILCILSQNHEGLGFSLKSSNSRLLNKVVILNSSCESRSKNSSSSRLYQTPSFPSYDELNMQKSEALRSLSSSHDGTWICSDGAISFSTTSDVSAGMTNKKRSPSYQANVSTRLGYSANGDSLKLVETFSWCTKDKIKPDVKEGGGGGETNSQDQQFSNGSMVGNTFFARQCPLGASMDIDSVDGSYSLHSYTRKSNNDGKEREEEHDDDDLDNNSESKKSSCALPKAISGVDGELISSIIEHCIVLNDNERTRCFLLYGKNGIYGQSNDDEGLEERLIRVVISHEHKPVENNVEDLLQVIEGKSRPQIGDDNRLSQLSSVIGDKGGDEMKKYPISLMTLSLGPWLGDLIVRDRSFNHELPTTPEKKESKGFGVPKKQLNERKEKEATNGFAEFVIGVQKAAMQFSWDYGTKVKHTLELGKSLGCYCEGWPDSAFGTLYEERMSRRLKPDDRTMYIDYDTGTYCGFIVGSVYVKAPRLLSFSNAKNGYPVHTEVSIFQRGAGEEIKDKEVWCSRITRTYSESGKLKQGSTSFFTLKEIAEPSMDNLSP